MTGWTYFFIILGVAFMTMQLFRVIDAIERPARRSRRRAMARWLNCYGCFGEAVNPDRCGEIRCCVSIQRRNPDI